MDDHGRYRELAAGAADGNLTPDETRTFELHLRSCAACRAEVHAFARDRDVLAAIDPTPVSRRLEIIVANPGRRRSPFRWPLLAAAVLVGTVGATLALTTGGHSGLVVSGPDNESAMPEASNSVTTSGGPVVRFRDGGNLTIDRRDATLAHADIDGDGDQDLVVGTAGTPDQIATYLGDGTGTFGGRAVTYLDGVRAFAVLDLDADGLVDILGSAGGDDAVVVLFGKGRGSFEDPIRIAVGQSPREIQAIDVDSDGRLDLVTANRASNDLSVVRAVAPRGYAPARSIPTVDAPTVLGSGDFDLDGHPDIVVGMTAGVAVHWGAGDGSFSDARPIPGAFASSDIEAADVDVDGDQDLAVTNAESGTVLLLKTRPSGPFWTELTLQAARPTDRPGDIEIADLTGDGVLDLIATNRGQAELLAWVGDGSGGFQPAQVISLDGHPRSIEVGDLDGDGRADVAVTHADDSTVSILLGS